MNTDEHRFDGAEKRFSPWSFRPRFGGSILTQNKAYHRPVLSAFIRVHLWFQLHRSSLWFSVAGAAGGGGGMWRARHRGRYCSGSRGRDAARAANIPPPIPGRRLREIPSARPSTCQRTCPDLGTIPHFCGFARFFSLFFRACPDPRRTSGNGNKERMKHETSRTVPIWEREQTAKYRKYGKKPDFYRGGRGIEYNYMAAKRHPPPPRGFRRR